MDSDSDDIYAPTDNVNGQKEVKMEDVDAEVEDGEEEGEEVEDDSDDEVNFITDAKEEPNQGPPSKRPATLKQPSPSPGPRSKSPLPQRPSTRERQSSQSQSISRDIKQEPDSHPIDESRPGTSYPPRHTSTIDPNGNPVHPTTGKPILSTDFDRDFPSESTKPWRKPGADISDYFNYGFDEFTWASYCLKQQQMPKEVKEINNQAEQIKAFVEGIPGGGMPGVPTGPSGGAAAGAGGMQMPGMPSETEMQAMWQNMMQQGIDPTNMDSNQFAQMMMGGGMNMGQGQPPTGPQGGFGGGGGFDQGGGGGFDGPPRGGRGRGRRGRGW
jgi:pre-mRNA 3'-end-processing factor FIP1